MGFDNQSAGDRTQNGSETRRRLLQTVGALGAAGLAGCTSGGGSDGASESESGSSSESGDRTVFTTNLSQRIGTIDPAKGTDLVQSMSLVNLYDSLTFTDADGNLSSHLATDWTTSSDNLSYTFQLRDDVTFHSGNSLTAEDVKFSAERLMDINQGFASLMTEVLSKENITVEDDYRISFTLDKVFSPFPASLALFYIVDKQAVMNNLEDGEFGSRGDLGQKFLNDTDAGTGAYKVDSFERGTELVLDKNEDYFLGFPEGSFDRVRVQIIKEDATVRSLMKTEELDMTYQYQAEETFNAVDEMGHAEVQEFPTFGMLYDMINTQKPPTDDIAVRKALAYGFDYETVVDEIIPVHQRAKGPMAPTWPVHNEDVLQPEYDPEKAKGFLEDAGYSEGDITLTQAYVAPYGFQKRIALLMQKNMEEIGIEVEVQPQTWGTVTEKAASVESTPHMTTVFYVPIYPSPDSIFYNQFHSEAANSWMNLRNLNNNAVDSMIDTARNTVDQAERAQIYSDLQQNIAEQYTDINLFHTTTRLGVNNRVDGITKRPAQGFIGNFRDYYLRE